MKIGIAGDHGGFELKTALKKELENAGYEITDFGAYKYDIEDDYPDYIIPLSRAMAAREIDRGIAICGSGVGACMVANKIAGVRAALIVDVFSARQGVEDDDMNIICMGGRVVGYGLALDLVRVFLSAKFKGEDRFVRRLNKMAMLETENRLRSE